MNLRRTWVEVRANFSFLQKAIPHSNLSCRFPKDLDGGSSSLHHVEKVEFRQSNNCMELVESKYPGARSAGRLSPNFPGHFPG